MAKRRRRHVRTLILGVLAMGVLVWGAVDTFEVPLERLWELFLQTLAVVAVLILAAAGAAVLWILLRRLLKRD
ncbi:hypothetical protein Q6D67_19620 [Haliea sp. E1-2-M8]|uniref:hypothetical protein n=1 Tax=Haliea sp. E1-2-M8 TaxID=3064706 RepID=UPI002728F13A|nr:hypothetical protein [Haliea sp. E1-2-M8]MDO8863901.1 hypothetical protein [Haliea sp. E1-2-M8]